MDRIALTVGQHDVSNVRLGWIHNTLELGLLGLSSNLRAEIEANSRLEIVEEEHALPFDAEGNLPFDVFVKDTGNSH